MSKHLEIQNFLEPYRRFTRREWYLLRHNAPLTLSEDDLNKLHGQIESMSLEEIVEVYLPLSRLLSDYVVNSQHLHHATGQFLSGNEPKVPFIIGVAGSVAVGKSTTSRVLHKLLSRCSNHPDVQVINTDGFLYSNVELEERGLANRKGFPESYRLPHLLATLGAIKSGKKSVKIPIYSHKYYDVLPDQFDTINNPDIVILEGLNILQVGPIRENGCNKTFVSDYLDFPIYVDASQSFLKTWFVERVYRFWNDAFTDPDSYFHYLTYLNQEELIKFATRVWEEINERNLIENILPFKNRAHLILEKNKDHSIGTIYLRKL